MKTRALLLVLMAALALSATTLSVAARPRDPEREPIFSSPEQLYAMRVRQAPATVSRILSSTPTATVHVTVSLRVAVRLGELADALAGHPGRVVDVWHVFVAPNSVFQGGYTLGAGETVTSAVVAYRESFLEQLEVQLQDLRTENGRRPDAALQRLMSDLELRLDDLVAHGPLIYGFSAEGRADTLIPFISQLALDKVAEVSDRGGAIDAMLFKEVKEGAVR